MKHFLSNKAIVAKRPTRTLSSAILIFTSFILIGTAGAGMLMNSETITYTLTNVRRVALKSPTSVYNISVKNHENYMVSNARILVHNCAAPPKKYLEAIKIPREPLLGDAEALDRLRIAQDLGYRIRPMNRMNEATHRIYDELTKRFDGPLRRFVFNSRNAPYGSPRQRLVELFSRFERWNTRVPYSTETGDVFVRWEKFERFLAHPGEAALDDGVQHAFSNGKWKLMMSAPTPNP